MEEGSQRNNVVLYVVSILYSVRVSMCVYYNIKVRVFSIIYGILGKYQDIERVYGIQYDIMGE